MRIFLSEFICSGALAGQSLPPSLLREGRAMRDAVAADLARLANTRVVMTCDPRTPSPAGVDSVTVADATKEWDQFERLCTDCDATLVVAPELDGELHRRVERAARLSRQLCNCTPDAVELCSDKLALAERLRQAGIATPPTVRLTEIVNRNGWDGLDYPVVAKPRWGAGSQSIYRCDTAGELRRVSGEFDHVQPTTEAIVQPVMPGRAVSAAVLFDFAAGRPPVTFPFAAQDLTEDGRFGYLGGQVPVPHSHAASWSRIVERMAGVVSGLRGYVGFDLLLPADHAAALQVIEINPRLTTSYIGYRALAVDNIAPLLVGAAASMPRWHQQVVKFDAAGEWHVQS
ncbi:MAG: ATP-grasp domain-containing protein [Planctomycetaceae bacterium]